MIRSLNQVNRFRAFLVHFTISGKLLTLMKSEFLRANNFLASSQFDEQLFVKQAGNGISRRHI